MLRTNSFEFGIFPDNLFYAMTSHILQPLIQPIFQVDAFTKDPFKGNPAGVCLLSREMPEAWMQSVAAEMNVAETAFLLPQDNGYDLRWFTPAVEVNLCGHATLASAHILWQTGALPANAQARFHTKSGLLIAELIGGLIEMDFPVLELVPIEAPAELFTALRLSPRPTYKTIFEYLVEVDTMEELLSLRPDFALLKTLPAEGAIVTCRADGREFDFASRYFAPAIGIEEDPATGSIHCALGPYWNARIDKDELRAYQTSNRGGSLVVKMQGNRVKLRGNAVTIFEGKLLI